MASVFQRKDGRWVLAWGKARERKTQTLPGVTTREEAEEARILFEAEHVRLKKERTLVPGLATLRQAIEAFRREKTATAAASTQVYYRTHFRNFETRLDLGKTLSAISTQDLEDFRDARKREVAPETVNKELGTLRAVWALALARRLTSHNPIAAVSDLREAEEDDQEDDEEPPEREVLACALRVLRARGRASPEHAEPYKLLARAFRTTWHASLRLGELCRLRPEDIRAADGAMRVRATRVKGGKRWTAIPTPIRRMIVRLSRQGHETVFACARTGANAYSSLRQLRDGFMKLYPSLKGAGFHAARHAFATAAAEVLEDSTRSKLLGHRRIAQTEHYTHRQIERLRLAQDAVRAAERARRVAERPLPPPEKPKRKRAQAVRKTAAKRARRRA